MTRLAKLLLAVALTITIPAVADAAYVMPDPGGRDGWVIDTSTGNILVMRAGTVVLTISSTGDLTTVDDLVITDDLTITGLATIGETLGVTGDVTLSGGAGALTFSGSAASIVVDDNDTTALVVGSTGALNLLTLDTGDGTETVVITGTTTQDALHVDTGTAQFDENVDVTGGVDVTGALTVSTTAAVTGNVTGSAALTYVDHTIGVDFSTFRIHDNIDAFLDQAAADDDDLTLIQGTFGTNATTVETIDCGGLADTTQYAAFWFVVPPTYPAGATVTVKANAGMVTTVADQSATLDFECYVPDYANEDASVSTDLITTAAQSVNFTTFADYSYTLDDDASGYELDAGTVVQCRVTALCDDDGDAGAGITIRINRIDVVVST